MRLLRARSLFGILLSVFVVPMSVAGTAVTLPAVSATLGTAPLPLQWVVNAFNVAFAGSTLLWGSAADRVGHHVVLRIGAGVFVAGSALSAAAPTLVVLDCARAAVGAGAAALLTASTGLIATATSPIARGRAFANFGVVMGVGLALGPTIAGILADAVGWRAAFATLGAVVLAGALLGGPLPGRTAAVLQRTTRLDAPLPPLHAVLQPRFVAVCCVPVLQALGCITLLTYLPLVLRASWHLAAAGAGVAMLLLTAPLLLASFAGTMMTGRKGASSPERVIVAALVSLLIGDVVLIGAHFLHPAVVAVGMALVGIGFGLPLGILDREALLAAPKGSTGTAAGVFNFVRLGAEAAAVAAFGATLNAVIHASATDAVARVALVGSPGTADLLGGAFAWVQGGATILVSAGTAITILLLRRSRAANTGTTANDSELPVAGVGRQSPLP
ncbi:MULTISPECIES: MFS transporter [unclassified Curtobacterium]|uniref:MFS transporter n=1 Tax=unclassified Curtobacterium TaxID=257496 RepID=UPI003A80EAF4